MAQNNDRTEIIEAVRDFDNLLKKCMDVKGDAKSLTQLSVFKRIKLAYYTYFKYPRLQNKLTKVLSDNIVQSGGNPMKFMNILAQTLVILLAFNPSEKEEDLNLFIKQVYDEVNVYNPLSIYLVQASENQLERCNFVLHTVSHLKDFYYNKVISMNIIFDLMRATCEIESTIHDSEDLNAYSDRNVLYHKNFAILSNGRLENPNYVFDDTLEANDLYDFLHHVLIIFKPLTLLVYYICTTNFRRRVSV